MDGGLYRKSEKMKQYETLHLVKQEDLNHHGTLFAARAAAWVVESGFTTAACEHGNTEDIVLRNLQNMSFFKPVKPGAVLKLTGRVVYAGSSSMIVAVTAKNAVTEEAAIEAYITFVTIDKENGGKRNHGILLDEVADEEERKLREKAQNLLSQRV